MIEIGQPSIIQPIKIAGVVLVQTALEQPDEDNIYTERQTVCACLT